MLRRSMLINIPLMIFFKVTVKICVLRSCRALNYAWIKEIYNICLVSFAVK